MEIKYDSRKKNIKVVQSILGIALAYLGKSWHLDRMVWLYEDMKDLPEYKKWLYWFLQNRRAWQTIRDRYAHKK
jgi:hypothetical protein